MLRQRLEPSFSCCETKLSPHCCPIISLDTLLLREGDTNAAPTGYHDTVMAHGVYARSSSLSRSSVRTVLPPILFCINYLVNNDFYCHSLKQPPSTQTYRSNPEAGTEWVGKGEIYLTKLDTNDGDGSSSSHTLFERGHPHDYQI